MDKELVAREGGNFKRASPAMVWWNLWFAAWLGWARTSSTWLSRADTMMSSSACSIVGVIRWSPGLLESTTRTRYDVVRQGDSHTNHTGRAPANR